ncbi:hypothetical protein M427DRAFT_68154 [Gonapodya prolifera JEL478]|uniref:Uncharacterized protein n=1 Tax=Gonapodya prolifera (strain JEL478) TaxID=1344416 RepID=A0A139AML0_GONPJ|nr:hypothetical protein M427DRAFT_68154 [Gonapodya prolifera JEL478]|eukprot:KXS18011.1 hypothetical protein M427DRAFT_68154 [Gonapodya prolifera JEL478]
MTWRLARFKQGLSSPQSVNVILTRRRSDFKGTHTTSDFYCKDEKRRKGHGKVEHKKYDEHKKVEDSHKKTGEHNKELDDYKKWDGDRKKDDEHTKGDDEWKKGGDRKKGVEYKKFEESRKKSEDKDDDKKKKGFVHDLIYTSIVGNKILDTLGLKNLRSSSLQASRGSVISQSMGAIGAPTWAGGDDDTCSESPWHP